MYTALYMPATRTQIYLTVQQRRLLDERAQREGRSLADVIREAIDAFLEQSVEAAEDALGATFGSMPGLEVPSRDGWDRDG